MQYISNHIQKYQLNKATKGNRAHTYLQCNVYTKKCAYWTMTLTLEFGQEFGVI